jgi:hypothetical protein
MISLSFGFDTHNTCKHSHWQSGLRPRRYECEQTLSQRTVLSSVKAHSHPMILLVAVLALQAGFRVSRRQQPENECDESLLIRTPLFLINQ